jgi:Zn-finger nucleic acid-binding protein
LLALALVALCSPVGASAAAKRPAGSVKLAAKNYKKVGTVGCGRIKGTWLPGTKLTKGYFVSHAQQAKNYAKAAKKKHGAAQKALTKKAKSFSTKAKKQFATCNKKPSTSDGSDSSETSGESTPPGALVPNGTAAAVRFNLANAAALALQAGNGTRSLRQGETTGSNVDVVGADGTVKDAVSSGTLVVSQFLIAPNGKLYASIQPTDLDGSGPDTARCILAEVDPATGVPTCIDSTLAYIDGRATVGYGPGKSVVKNPVVQFDQQGAIYYTGGTTDGKGVLRRYLNGTTTDLITDSVSLMDFLVQSDGSVVISGKTMTTGADWTRRVSPTGGLQTLAATKTASWFRGFPDGGTYFGFNDGVQRIASGTSTLESKWWIARGSSHADPYWDTAAYCPMSQTPPEGSSVCNGSGGVMRMFQTTDDKVFSVTAEGEMFEYYPTLAHVPMTVKNIRVAQAVITNAIVAGLDANGQNVTQVLNTSNNSEKTLIGPDNEIEVYHVNYVASSNKVMFDGLRFSDNKYVIGEVSLNGGTVNTVASGSVRWSDLQSFG